VVIGLGTVCLGSAARYLGRLAMTVGDREAALEHFRAAVQANAALRTPLFLAHSQLDYARALGPGSPEAEELIATAAETARQLGLANVGRRAAALQAG
jgi:hypothetical protein